MGNSILNPSLSYHAFGSTIAERSASFGAKYRHGMNTQEKELELGEGITSAEYWMYDGKLGRRWNVDPRQVIQNSPYACFLNNPICGSDPFGDTTVFRNEKGEVKYQLNDGLEYEIIFANENYLSVVQQFLNQNIDDQEEIDEAARIFRNPSIQDFAPTFEMYMRYETLLNGRIARISLETQTEMKDIAKAGNSAQPPTELGFLTTTDENKVMHLTKLKTETTATERSMEFEQAVWLTYNKNDKLMIDVLKSSVGWGHLHPSVCLKGVLLESASQREKLLQLNEPSLYDREGRKMWTDYTPQLLPSSHSGLNVLNVSNKRNSLAFIISEYGFTIYYSGGTSDSRVPILTSDYLIYQK